MSDGGRDEGRERMREKNEWPEGGIEGVREGGKKGVREKENIYTE